MRKWARRLGMAAGAIVVLFAGLIAYDAMDHQGESGLLKEENLPVLKPGWQGNPTDQKGRFINDEFPFIPRISDILKWKFVEGNKFKDTKAIDTRRVEVKDPSAFLAGSEDGIMWLGHASFFIRIDGVSVLTDPVFGDPTFLKRFVPVASPIEQITAVDIVLISHDHRDHMDEQSIRSLGARFPSATFVAGLRSEELLRSWVPSNPIQTIGWFQQMTEQKGLKISFVPVRHWSRRGLMDTNWRLWGGYVIEGREKKVYFGGDSGYGRHYRETGELFPDIDFFLIGIGAYEPRWFMEPNHNSPAEAVKGFQDAGARTLIPMHYGTFDLSDEPPGAPLENLLKEGEAAGVRDRIKPLAIHEFIPLSH